MRQYENYLIFFRTLLIFFILHLPLFATESYDCYKIATKVEKQFNIPHKLLSSISITEAGTTKNGYYQAWPWSINNNGKSIYFNNKGEMINFINNAISSKQMNLDIGCMQINYKYHGKKFKDIDSMTNPEENIYYAGKFLKELYTRYRSWNTAISRYHSSDPKRMKVYLKKVTENWEKNREGKYEIKNPLKVIESKKAEIRKKKNINSKIIHFRKLLRQEKTLIM